jgi:hypothetical protein
VPADRRRAPVLDDKAAAVLAELGVRVEQHYGAPQDIEWARADGEFYIVQSRPITALPEPEAAPPPSGRCPTPKAFYFRASIVEQLPDPLSPLFAAMVDGSVTRSLQALMREFLRVDVVAPGVGLPTVNGYAYYRYSRAAMWQMTVGGTRAMRRLPAMGLPNWRDVAHPAYQAAVAAWRDRPQADLTDAELLDGVQELLDAGTRYYTAVQAIIPLAAFSEVSFTRFYDALVRRPGEPARVDVPRGLRQRADPGREVAVEPRGVDARPPGARRRGARRSGRGLGGRRPRARRRVARPLPRPPRPLRARHLQPRLHAPHRGRRPGPRCSRRCGSRSTAGAQAPPRASWRRRPGASS